jgi:hypothetical protein
MMMDEPASFEEMKKDAPAEWSFGSIEDLDEPDQADWWKADDPEQRTPLCSGRRFSAWLVLGVRRLRSEL